MDFKQTVRRRRMVRNYDPRPIDRSAVERIAAAGRSGPTAGFSQGIYLIVVTDQQTRRAIAEVAAEDAYVAAGLDPWISNAPVHIVLCTREDDYHERYREPDKLNKDGSEIEWPIPYWYVDAGAALALILLAAVDEGLAAGFLGSHRLGDLRRLLGIPEDVLPIGIATIGHPAPDRRSGSLKRGWKQEESVIRWERW